MKIELRGLRLNHPRRYFSQGTVRIDDGDELLAVIAYPPAQSDYRPVIRVKAVVDRDFLVLLLVGIM
jgi:hypothetical protein